MLMRQYSIRQEKLPSTALPSVPRKQPIHALHVSRATCLRKPFSKIPATLAQPRFIASGHTVILNLISIFIITVERYG